MGQLKAFIPKRSTFKRCSRCHEQMFFIETVNSKKMPVDIEASSNGNLSITERTGVDEEGKPLYPFGVVVSPGQAEGMRAAGLRLYQSHMVDCPYADEFRKKARSRGKWKR